MKYMSKYSNKNISKKNIMSNKDIWDYVESNKNIFGYEIINSLVNSDDNDNKEIDKYDLKENNVPETIVKKEPQIILHLERWVF